MVTQAQAFTVRKSRLYTESKTRAGILTALFPAWKMENKREELWTNVTCWLCCTSGCIQPSLALCPAFCVSLPWPVSVMCVYLYGFHITRSISHTALLFVFFFFCEQNILRPDRPAQTGTLQRRLHARQKKNIFALELPSMVKPRYCTWREINLGARRVPDSFKTC